MREACKSAWEASDPYSPENQHEEGGWIYWNPKDNKFRVDPWPSGNPKAPDGSGRLHIDPPPQNPPDGYITVGFYHTHPPDFKTNSLCKASSGKDKKFMDENQLPDLIITGPYFPGNPPNLDLPLIPPPNIWIPLPQFPPGYPDKLC